MKREWLQDYSQKELQELDRYFKKVQTSGLSESDRFPEPSRFSTRLIEPIVIADRRVFYFDNEKIWSQIPFAGTLIIPLHPVPEKDLLTATAFDKSDINKLIDLAKETGRVQFMLAADPLFYEGLDYLDPIFEQLNPPLMQTVPYSAYTKDGDVIRWQEEFRALASISFAKHVEDSVRKQVGDSYDNAFQVTMLNRQSTYVRLKVLRQDDLLEWLSALMIDEPEIADIGLGAIAQATDPLFSGLRGNTNFSLKRVKAFGLDALGLPQTSSIKYPIEIGKFLMQKIAINPSSYYGCLDVIEHYDKEQLYKVLQSLDKGVKEQMMDNVVSDVRELEDIMNNIWSTAQRIGKASKVIQGGFRIALGLAGLGLSSMVLPPAASPVGLLAALGVNVADQYFEGKGLGERIAKLLNKRYIATIYDFSQKYSLPASPSQ
ncbi:MAG: hypothetical protein QXJ74_01900 [Nitrososphaera sp.]|uniref:hypothetical protein n=1 Tax=Nitrososphaera sp. TaxID=1971748 RepID=UPI0017EE1C9D|nr:hypothetical protein [Nitrososphaera sp.]NWG38304.1 hypothetical protein [Nitrososphaera sp.]